MVSQNCPAWHVIHARCHWGWAVAQGVEQVVWKWPQGWWYKTRHFTHTASCQYEWLSGGGRRGGRGHSLQIGLSVRPPRAAVATVTRPAQHVASHEQGCFQMLLKLNWRPRKQVVVFFKYQRVENSRVSSHPTVSFWCFSHPSHKVSFPVVFKLYDHVFFFFFFLPRASVSHVPSLLPSTVSTLCAVEGQTRGH